MDIGSAGFCAAQKFTIAAIDSATGCSMAAQAGRGLCSPADGKLHCILICQPYNPGNPTERRIHRTRAVHAQNG